MPKVKNSWNKFSKPFILFSNKSKTKFVNSIVSEIEISLLKSGKKMSLHNKFVLQTNLMRIVGLLK